MIAIFSNKWLLWCIRVIVGMIFIYAGCSKLAAPEQFADSIASFELLPGGLINILALGLPSSEMLAGLMMVVGWRHQAATLFTMFLTAIFALALGQALARGLQVDCGCFGAGKPSIVKTWLSLGRDCLLLASCVLVYVGVSRLKVQNRLLAGNRLL